MKCMFFKKALLSFMLVSAFMLSAFPPIKAEANTGFVDNAYSQSSPYSFTWSNTNGLAVDATNSTKGMFVFNYDFKSGSDWLTELGHPTTYLGVVDIDVFSANVRADKNVSQAPPQYGMFSGEFMTQATNPYFSQPVNPHYWYVETTESPDGLAIYDTLQQGINSQQSAWGQYGEITINPDGGTGVFLQPTSIK